MTNHGLSIRYDFFSVFLRLTLIAYRTTSILKELRVERLLSVPQYHNSVEHLVIRGQMTGKRCKVGHQFHGPIRYNRPPTVKSQNVSLMLQTGADGEELQGLQYHLTEKMYHDDCCAKSDMTERRNNCLLYFVFQ